MFFMIVDEVLRVWWCVVCVLCVFTMFYVLSGRKKAQKSENHSGSFIIVSVSQQLVLRVGK